MKNVKLKLAVFGALGLMSAQAMSLGLVNIPTTGFATSAYTLCNTTGNFGSGSVGNGNPPINPTAGANNTCAIILTAPVTDTKSPETNYALVTSATRSLVVNNIYTGSTNKTVGSILEVVWRKPAASAPVTATPMCIIGTKVTLTNVDYNTVEAGSQRFEVNDLARGGLSGLAVDAGYAIIQSTNSPVYRIGRAYTSVQHRATAPGDTGGAIAGVNYLDLPGLGATAVSINGVNRYNAPPLTTAKALPLPNPVLPAEQDAGVNAAWVDFTFDVNAVDDDGSTNPASAMTYVKVACNNDSAATINSTVAPAGWSREAGALRVRQTAQEKAPFISISTRGYVLPGQPAVTPANVAPF